MSQELLSSTSINLEEGTFQLLTQDPNKWISVVRLYNLLSKDHPSLKIDKKEYLLRCELLNTRFKNVRKSLKNSICHLAFVTDDNSLLSPELTDLELYESNAFKALDKCEVIEYMINNSQYCSNLSLTEFFDGNDTVVHILFKNGRVDLVNKLLTTFHIDFSVKNSEGKSLFDVINYNDMSNASKLVKLVYENQISALKLSHSADLNLVKQNNSYLLELNKKLTKENSELKKKLDSGSYSLSIFFVLMCALMVGYYLQT